MFQFKAQIMDEAAMTRSLKRIAHEILESTNGGDSFCLVGIHRRGVPLAERIATQLEAVSGLYPAVGRLDITLYRDDLSEVAPSPTLHKTEIPFSITGKAVILVDDVLYTGRTARAAIDAVFALGRPARVQLAALIDRGHRELPVRADFIGKNIPTALNEVIAVHIPPYDDEMSVSIYETISNG